LEPLKKSGVNKNPFRQFTEWYDKIQQSGIKEPSAMTLATADKNGVPSARTVLLKGFNDEGFLFFTNYNSRKGKDLSGNPFAELLFYWMNFNRQVRISGRVEKVNREESEKYFNFRPLASRIAAWASRQSEIIPGRDYLEKQYEKYEKEFGSKVPLPEYWGGFRLIPERFEFWQGRENRMHDRISYIKKENMWEIVRLSP